MSYYFMYIGLIYESNSISIEIKQKLIKVGFIFTALMNEKYNIGTNINCMVVTVRRAPDTAVPNLNHWCIVRRRVYNISDQIGKRCF